MLIHPKQGMAITLIFFLGILVFAPVLVNSATAQDEDDSKDQEMLDIDYMNRFYKGVRLEVPPIALIRVNDLRQRDTLNIGPSTVGTLGGDKDLLLSVTVKEFVEKSFMQLLAGDEESGRLLELELNIEEFRLDQKKSSLLNNQIGFIARISATVVQDGNRIETGYIQNYANWKVPSNIKENLADMMYSGIVDMARQLNRKISAEEIKPGIDGKINMEPVKESKLQFFTGEETEFTGMSFSLHTFTGDLMEDTYGSFLGYGIYGGYWLKGRSGFRASLILGKANGTPVINESPDLPWEIASSKIKMYIAELGGSYLYSLRKNPAENIFNPFIGVGFMGIFGFEKVEASASWSTVSSYFEFENFHLWSLRASFAPHILIGSTFRVTDETSLLVEARWTLGGKGGALDWRKEEEMEFVNATLLDAVRRSDFNFTGWSIHVGLEF